jgi:Ni,Fe-hydrogenase maturation factor
VRPEFGPQSRSSSRYRLTQDDIQSRRKELVASPHQFGVLEALHCHAATTSVPEVVILAVVPEDYRNLATDPTLELESRLESIVNAVLKEINWKEARMEAVAHHGFWS